MDWQPIETAPKDGSAIVVWPPTWRGVLSVARWDSDYGKKSKPYWRRVDAYAVMDSRSNPPTHWASIPAGPDAAAPEVAGLTAALEQAKAEGYRQAIDDACTALSNLLTNLAPEEGANSVYDAGVADGISAAWGEVKSLAAEGATNER